MARPCTSPGELRESLTNAQLYGSAYAEPQEMLQRKGIRGVAAWRSPGTTWPRPDATASSVHSGDALAAEASTPAAGCPLA